MRKLCFVLFSSLLFSSFLYAQSTINKITQSYFRSDPFTGEFSQFLKNLINDPTFVRIYFYKKTDTTLFYLQGNYSNHSPFFFPLTGCKIVLAEQQDYTDSSKNEFYTYFVYQLIGYAKDGEEGRKDIQTEFEKLSRQFKKGFKSREQKELKTSSGEITNYSMPDIPFYPLSVAWTSSADNKNNLLVISVRFYTVNNYAFLPKSTNSP